MPQSDREEDNTMGWTSKKRLALIKALAAKSLYGPKDESYKMLMERIMFLCDMPAEFLQENKENYQDVIDIAENQNGLCDL